MNSLLLENFIWLLLAIAHHAQASTFNPECTLPPPGTAYVSGPNIRGTTSILFNCLSIIFLCTWNIQHLNVPAARSQPKSSIQGIWWAILDSRTRLKWMIFTILVPEYLTGKAFAERVAASAGVKRMKRILREPNDEVERARVKLLNDAVESLQWEGIHVYMANMGYFVVDFSDVLDDHQGMK
jgi:hypothetical protein